MKWFYTLRNSVKGPYSTQEFETALNQLGTDISSTLFWTRGRSEWLPAERWTPAEQALTKPQPAATLNVEPAPAFSNENLNTLAELKLEDTIEASESNIIPEHFDFEPVSSEPQPMTPKAPATKALQPEPVAQPQKPDLVQKKSSSNEIKKDSKNSAPAQTIQNAPEKKSTAKNQPAPVTIKPQPDVEPPSRIADVQDIIVPSDDEITRLLGATAVEVIESVSEKVDEKFRVQYNGADQPVMSRKELIEFTSLQADPGLIMVWDKKANEWKEIYTFTDIIEKLGISRRENRRVTILGQFKGKAKDGRDLSIRLTTISTGGFGLTDCFDLKVGDMITGQITSPHFYSPLAVAAEVTYAGSHGNVGLRFTTINEEAQALVVDYIKKFGKGIKTENG